MNIFCALVPKQKRGAEHRHSTRNASENSSKSIELSNLTKCSLCLLKEENNILFCNLVLKIILRSKETLVKRYILGRYLVLLTFLYEIIFLWIRRVQGHTEYRIKRFSRR